MEILIGLIVVAAIAFFVIRSKSKKKEEAPVTPVQPPVTPAPQPVQPTPPPHLPTWPPTNQIP